MDNSAGIRTTGLTKRFGARNALSDLDLIGPQGPIFGYLGPNGSGKAVTLKHWSRSDIGSAP